MGSGVLLRDGGAVDEKTIMEYIENQKWEEDAGAFKITASAEP